MRKAAEKLGAIAEAGSWYRAVRAAKWQSLVHVHDAFASADTVGDFLIFHIRHNGYRHIVRMDASENLLLLKGLITHNEYSRGRWKKWK